MRTLILAIIALFIGACGDTDYSPGRLVVHSTYGSTVTCSTASSDGSVCVEQDVEALDDVAVGDDLTVSDDASVGGDLAVTGGMTLANPAMLYQVIRFCGNGPTGGTETFVSPVPFDDTEADFIDGGAGCDGEDDATIGNADEPWPLLKDAAFKPVAMICTAICTAAGVAASDTVIFRLMDDTAAVAGMTCTTASLGGDANAVQCNVTDTTPATVAAGSLLAIGIDTAGTADECGDAGDDFSCLLYVTF